MQGILPSLIAKRFFLFIAGGGINTAFTYGIYLSLSNLVNYQCAYFIAYFIGVIIAYWFNSTVVFRVEMSWKRLFTYPLIYLIQYSLSAICLEVFVAFWGFSKVWAPLWVTACMLPVTFLMNKLVLK